MLEQCPAKLEPLIIQILEHSLVLKKNLVLLHFLLKTPKSPNAGALSSWNGTSSNPNTVCTSSWKSRSWFFHIFYWSLQHSPNAGALSSWTTSPNIYLQLNNKFWFYHIFYWGLQFILENCTSELEPLVNTGCEPAGPNFVLKLPITKTPTII